MNLTVLHAHYVPAVLTTFSLFLNHITLTSFIQMEEYSFWNIILPYLPMVVLVSMSSLQNGPPEHPTFSSHLVSRPYITHCFYYRTWHYLKFSSFICLLSLSPLSQCEFQESGNFLFLLDHTVFTEPASVWGAEKALRQKTQARTSGSDVHITLENTGLQLREEGGLKI